MAGWEWLRLPGLRLLWWAVWAEFLLVRLLSRVGIYIPKGDFSLVVYNGALFVGEVAFNLSLIVAALYVVYTVVFTRHYLLLVPAAVLLLAPGVAASAGWSMAAALLMAGAVVWLGVGVLPAPAPGGLRAALLLVLSVHVLGYGVSAAQLAWTLFDLPGSLPGAGSLIRFGELLALPAPVILLLGARGRTPVAIVAGLGAALALGAGYWANSDLTAILAMYSLGFSLSWPATLYLLALGAGIPAMVWLLRTHPVRGLALGLLFLVGYSLTVNQQHLVVLAAWGALSLPEHASQEAEVAA